MAAASTWALLGTLAVVLSGFTGCHDLNPPDSRPDPPPQPLVGWVDMHAHPMTHLAFGGKLIHGAPDVGSLIPADSSCRHRVRATSLEHALGTDNSTHGGKGWFDNDCGDDIRKGVIDTLQTENEAEVTPDWARGATDFLDWPRWNDITHQKMWVDWIRRAHWGGLRVMVALATHNQTLAAAVSGPGDRPTDDLGSADLQLDEMIAFVGRHGDFMELARTPAQLRRIVGAGRLAIVLGVEMDTIGGFGKGTNPTETQVTAEIRRLHDKGIRYIFPIHVIDNKFGGTAVYKKGFNLSNYREYGSFWDLRCSEPADNVSFDYSPDGFDAAFALVKVVKLGIDPFRNPPTPPSCPEGTGHVNARGLTALGRHAIREMMGLGVLIDIDHMSQAAAECALTLAETVPGGGYPMSSGHNGFRGAGGTENSRTDQQIRRIAALGGMFGVGTEAADPATFVRSYAAVASRMGNRGVALGTDLNGLVKGPQPASLDYDPMFPRARTGSRSWDFNVDGVAHYGLLPDFLKAVELADGGAEARRILFRSAEHFAQTWEAAARQRDNVPRILSASCGNSTPPRVPPRQATRWQDCDPLRSECKTPGCNSVFPGGSDLHGAHFENSPAFDGRELEGSNFHGAHFENATVLDLEASHSCLHGAHFERATARDADLRCACLHGVHFDHARLEGDCDFRSAYLYGADFRHADLNGCRFEGAHIERSDFRNATLTGACFAGVDYGPGNDFTGAIGFGAGSC